MFDPKTFCLVCWSLKLPQNKAELKFMGKKNLKIKKKYVFFFKKIPIFIFKKTLVYVCACVCVCVYMCESAPPHEQDATKGQFISGV